MAHLPRALVIGSSGGIGESLVRALVDSGHYSQVFAVSRSLPEAPVEGVNYHVISRHDEDHIAQYCQQLALDGQAFSVVVCCIGCLTETLSDGQSIWPEKRLEDLNQSQLMHYFTVNTIVPALWLKQLEPLVKGEHKANLVFLSARVASITDNSLGGWYGYRASKAALNMLLKTAQIEFQRRAKNVSVVCYHPGTVDTALSKPFQANVKPQKLFSAAFTAQQLLSLLPDFEPAKGPYYIDWEGKSIPW